MSNISRRSILAGLGVSPLIARPSRLLAESEGTPVASKPRKLYLYIHGAVVVDAQRNGLVLHAPRVTMMGKLAHEYRCGYGMKGEGYEVYPGAPLALIGFKGSSSALALDNTTIPYLGRGTVDPGQNFCSLVTPIPTKLSPFRQIQRTAAGGDFFPGIPDLKYLQFLPTALRADFDLQPNEQAFLVGGNWKDDGIADPVVLHLRAEPGDPAYSNHDAFLAMSVTLGTQIQLAPCYSKACAKYADKEERSLLEVNQGSTGGGVAVPPCSKESLGSQEESKLYLLASRPANCVTITVNNSGG